MREKKVRGINRKSYRMVKMIEANTVDFPTEFYNGYWHLHLPVAQDFISSKKTPKKSKRLCIQTLLDRAEHLIALKPNGKEIYRVVAAVYLPNLWDSQIIVFEGDSYFKKFFNRDGNQKWINLPSNRNFETEWELSIPNDMNISGVKEVITDEDGHYHEGEIWFIGELT